MHSSDEFELRSLFHTSINPFIPLICLPPHVFPSHWFTTHLGLYCFPISSLHPSLLLPPPDSSNSAKQLLSGFYHFLYLTITSITSWCSCAHLWSPHIQPRGGFRSCQPQRSAGSVPDPTSHTVSAPESPVADKHNRISCLSECFRGSV